MTQEPNQATTTPAPKKTKTIALVLSFLGCFAVCGIQRFYVGKIGTGVLYLLTFGLLGIGQLVDFIMILMGTFKDKDGNPLTEW